MCARSLGLSQINYADFLVDKVAKTEHKSMTVKESKLIVMNVAGNYSKRIIAMHWGLAGFVVFETTKVQGGFSKYLKKKRNRIGMLNRYTHRR